MEYSKNTRAKEIVGLRQDSLNIKPGSFTICVDLPIEFGYMCPVCKKLSEGLDWSEYNGFLWCDVCNKDYPTCICHPDIDKQIDLFLDFVNYTKNLNFKAKDI